MSINKTGECVGCGKVHGDPITLDDLRAAGVELPDDTSKDLNKDDLDFIIELLAGYQQSTPQVAVETLAEGQFMMAIALTARGARAGILARKLKLMSESGGTFTVVPF